MKKWVSQKHVESTFWNIYLFSYSTKIGEFNDSIVVVNEKLDGMDSMNKTFANNLMNMEIMNQTVKDNSFGLKVLNGTMGKSRNHGEL